MCVCVLGVGGCTPFLLRSAPAPAPSVLARPSHPPPAPPRVLHLSPPQAIADSLAQITPKGAITIIGGGDSVAAVEKAGKAELMSHISTGAFSGDCF